MTPLEQGSGYPGYQDLISQLQLAIKIQIDSFRQDIEQRLGNRPLKAAAEKLRLRVDARMTESRLNETWTEMLAYDLAAMEEARKILNYLRVGRIADVDGTAIIYSLGQICQSVGVDVKRTFDDPDLATQLARRQLASEIQTLLADMLGFNR